MKKILFLSAIMAMGTHVFAQEIDSVQFKKMKEELRKELLKELDERDKNIGSRAEQVAAKQRDETDKPVNPATYLQSSDEHTRIKVSGLIRHDVFADTRQTIGVGEGMALLGPRDRMLDADGKDINGSGSFHMLSIISRFGLDFTGPKVLGARTSGVLDGEFFGNSEAGINELRLRTAWLRLDWKNTQLGFGQWWHPFMNLQALPGVVNYATGVPFMPLLRSPQVRLTHKINNFSIIATALSQRDFTPQTLPYRQSGLPQFNLHAVYGNNKVIFGAAGHVENLKPKLGSGDPVVYSDERVTSWSGKVYGKYMSDFVNILVEANAIQNSATFLGLGGFVGYMPENGGVEVYRTMRNRSLWADFQFGGKVFAPGLFVGYTENRGVSDPVANSISTSYGFTSSLGAVSATNGGRTIADMYKVIPRIDVLLGKLRFRLEGEYGNANWVDAMNTGTGTENPYRSDNFRVQFATFFFF